MSEDLSKLDATAQAELVRDGEVEPIELVDAAIARIEKTNPELNAVIHTLFDQARGVAADPELPDGPFRGVPFLLKDLDTFTEGDPFHCGTKHLKRLDFRPDHDTWLAERFRAAGLVLLGKTNTPELGLTVTTEPEAYGPSRNPWNLEHSTGGSSGGSAAAVAAGLVPVAHAGDGGGSIRIPASECGLVGLKPSRGRISLGPDAGETWAGFVTSHVVSRTVRDTAAMLDCVAGPMPGDPYAAPSPVRPFADEVRRDPGKRRVGLLRTNPSGEVHPECVAAVDATGAALESLGHDVAEAHPEAFGDPATTQHFMTILAAWVAATLDEIGTLSGEAVTPEGVEPGTWALAELGRQTTAAQYVEATKWVNAYTRRMASWWASGFDLLVTPTIAQPPPRLGFLSAPPGDPFGATAKVLALIPYTPPFNMTGQPAISLPLHWTPEGLPVGVQIAAAYGREDLLIRIAGQLEQALPWKDRLPPVHASR